MSFPRYPKYKDSGVEWLGKVPAHWGIEPLKRRFQIVGGSTPKSENAAYWDGDILWATPADLSKLDTRYLCATARMITPEGLASCNTTLVPANSIVLSTRAPIGSLAIAKTALCTNQGCKSLIPYERTNPGYFAHLLGISSTELNIRGKGTTFLEISGDALGAFTLPVPPLAEQLRIAEFLDRETAKIDDLVAEQRRLMELLKEKRQAVISDAITKGLNPQTALKASGIAWLGAIPIGWRVMSLGRVTTSRCDGPFGSGLKSEHYTAAGVRVIRLQNIRHDGFDDRDAVFIDADYYRRELNGHDVIGGDVLIAGLGDDKNTVGRACVAPEGIEPAMVKADCFRFRLDTTQVLADFVGTGLSASSRVDAGFLSSGSTRSRIPLSDMATRKLAIPPLCEQSAIMDFLRAQSRRFDALIAEAQRAIDLLQERRAALISAAVTGQIDVRECSPARERRDGSPLSDPAAPAAGYIEPNRLPIATPA